MPVICKGTEDMAKHRGLYIIFRIAMFIVLLMATLWTISFIIQARVDKNLADLHPKVERITAEASLDRVARVINEFHRYGATPDVNQQATPAPTENRELVAWFNRLGLWLDPNTVQDGLLVDIWGRPVHLIAEDGQLKQLGSAGPNGQWEQGAGDDLLSPEIDPYQEHNEPGPWQPLSPASG